MRARTRDGRAFTSVWRKIFWMWMAANGRMQQSLGRAGDGLPRIACVLVRAVIMGIMIYYLFERKAWLWRTQKGRQGGNVNPPLPNFFLK